MTARQIDAYLRRVSGGRSPLIGRGASFIRYGRANGVDPRLLVAIAGAESSFGMRARNNNPFGWGPHIPFKSWDDAIRTVARGLRTGYLSEGRRTIEKIGEKWAPIGAGNDPTNLNSNWVQNVSKFYEQLGGQGAVAAPAAGKLDPVALTVPGSEGPDAGDLALEQVSRIGMGERYDPLAQLEALVQASRQEPQPAVDAGRAPRGGGRVGGRIRPGGGWGGSRNIVAGYTRGLGLAATGKRDRKNTSTGGISDHWVGSKTAYASDLSGSVGAMDVAAVKLARQLGIRGYRKGQPLVFTTTRQFGRRKYRIQVLYRTMTGGNHFTHIHFGARLA